MDNGGYPELNIATRDFAAAADYYSACNGCLQALRGKVKVRYQLTDKIAAGMGTKPVTSTVLERHMNAINMVKKVSRHIKYSTYVEKHTLNMYDCIYCISSDIYIFYR